MNQSAHLYRLQIIDLELDKIQLRVVEINHLIESDETVKAAKNAFEEKTKLSQQAKHKVRESEEAVKTVQIKIQTNEASLYGGRIGNPKELQDLQKENELLKRRLSELENEQLEMMIFSEEAENDLEKAALILDHAEADAIQRNAHLKGEQSTIEAKKERLTIEKQVLSGSIQPDNLHRYEELRQRKQGVAVSRIEESACTVCGSTIRPSVIQEARSTDKMATCPSCSRILYIN